MMGWNINNLRYADDAILVVESEEGLKSLLLKVKDEVKRRLLLGIKAMKNLDSVLKSRDITLPTKVCIVKAIVSPVVMYGCESWKIKQLSTKELMPSNCSAGVLRVQTARRSNQSVLKKISPEYSLEGLMLKMKLQYFGHLLQSADSLEKTLMLGKIEGRRRRGRQRMRWLDGITDGMDMGWTKLLVNTEGQGSLPCCSPWGLKESDMTEWLNYNSRVIN